MMERVWEEMTFEVFEKSPEVAPLLVRLYDTHNLYALAQNADNGNSCQELTGIMVDLLNVRLSDRESELITDVLIALMKQAERDLKTALSERLSTYDTVPLRMILSLANEEIYVAEPVLRRSSLLHDLDLLYIIQSKGIAHSRVIATRHGLGADVIDMLADTKDFETAVNLSVNDGVKLTQHAFAIIGEMAKEREALARPLLSRADVPHEIAERLYEFVGEELKAELSDRFGEQGENAAEHLDDIMHELRGFDMRQAQLDMMMAHARNRANNGALKVSDMIASLRRGQYVTFKVQFAAYCNLPFNTVKNMLTQESGKGLATICKGMEIVKADFVSLFLLTDRFRSMKRRVIGHKELSRIMTIYDEIELEDAKRILKNSRH